MLLTLVGEFLTEGKDAWKLAIQAGTPRVELPDNANDQDKERETAFSFRLSALQTLFCILNQNVCRSTTIVCEVLHRLHTTYFSQIGNKDSNVKFLRAFASPTHWRAKVTLPAWEQAIFTERHMIYVGLEDGVPAFDVPLFGSPSEDCSDDQVLLFTHVRNATAHQRELALWAVLHQEPPWSFVLLGSKNTEERECELDRMQKFWAFSLDLQHSPLAAERRLWDSFPFLKWPVLVEVMGLYELCDFSADDPDDLNYKRGTEYTDCMFDGPSNSVIEENMFNADRNEQERAARHKSRGSNRLQAVHLCAVRKHCADYDHIEMEPQDTARLKGIHLKSATYDASTGPKSMKELGVDPEDIYIYIYICMYVCNIA